MFHYATKCTTNF